MKQQISPGIVIAVIVIILAGVGFFLFKGTGGGGGSLPTGTTAPANSSPFGPGGKANTEFGASKKGGN